MSLHIVPISLRDAQAFVAAHHRHHDAPKGHKFSIGVASGETLVGVVIVGRPISRVIAAEGGTLEVLRTATDGTMNANSMLYGAARKATFALGFDRLITYTQEGESGASLRGAGFVVLAQRPPRRGWSMPARPRKDSHPTGVARTLWESRDGA